MQFDKVFGGSSGAINAVLFISATITPGALAASLGMKEEAYTVGPGNLQTTDLVYVLVPPAATQANCCAVAARVSSATQITNIYANLTAAANVPTPGVYGWLVVRP